jgi:hypothetical protein
MSSSELAWRARSEVGRRLRRSHPRAARLRWDDPAWRELLGTVVAPSKTEIVDAAARIVRGELDFWGRDARLDPAQVPWGQDPLDGMPFSERPWRKAGRDLKPIAELHRQQHLVPLAAGAAAARRTDWGDACVTQLLGWIEDNPPARGPGWSSGYEVAHRLVGWSCVLPLLLEHVPAAALASLSESFAFQAHFVADRPSRYSSANNHRLAELAGLLAAARVGVPGLAWPELWEELESEAVRQTFADGGSREQASGYFLYVLEILWFVGLLARAHGQPLGPLEDRLETMVLWVEAVADERGEPPPVGDDAEDRLLRLDYFEARKATEVAGRVRALLGTNGFRPDGASALLTESGYAVLRGQAEGQAVRVIFDIGQLGFGRLAAHGHADALSVLVDVGGRALLRDSGTETYAPGPVREEYRATRAHNTITVGGASQAQSLGPHLWGRRFETTLEAAALRNDLDYVRARHDGYRAASGARHIRSVAFLKPGTLIVLDRVRARAPYDVDLHWHLPPDVPENRTLAVTGSPSPARTESPVAFSPRYTWRERATRVTYTSRGSDVVFATVLALDGSQPRVELLHAEHSTRIEIDGSRRLTIIERWSGDTFEVNG